ncbi:hypothetical protein [Thiocystis violacea]|uniref:hypothetical protein n=1 Tax=Thiocystis violacea TaxID=13725 RepID=UPI00190698DD|nr:hypothetical protein [Thiocystis violacea]MBK1717085.1 hypothetical protein [Thiocystis violacea]
MTAAPFDLVDARDSFTDTDWFHACRNAQTPYVVIRSGEMSADVLWDYVTLPPCCDARIQANFAALEREVRAIFDRFAVPGSYLRIKPTLICFDHLPVAQAKRAASDLYGVIASYLPSGPSPSRPEAPRKSDSANPPPDVHDINRPIEPDMGNRRFWMEERDHSPSPA